nr:hypothetical protein [Tanacetum cinerariifolium]
MAWRHHDSSVTDPFSRLSEYNAFDVAKLREVIIPFRRPPLSILYAAGLSNVWKQAGRAFSIKDLDGKGNILVSLIASSFVCSPIRSLCSLFLLQLSPWLSFCDFPISKVEKSLLGFFSYPALQGEKKRKAGEKAAAKVLAVNTQAKTVVNKDAGKVGPRKKKRLCAGAQVHPDSEHVSSPIPLNQVKPIEALANEERVSPPLSVGFMDTLRVEP